MGTKLPCAPGCTKGSDRLLRHPGTTLPWFQAVTLTRLQVGEHVEVAPSKRTKVTVSSAPASAQGKLKAIAKDARLEDEVSSVT